MKNGKLYCAMIFSIVIFQSIFAKNENKNDNKRECSLKFPSTIGGLIE